MRRFGGVLGASPANSRLLLVGLSTCLALLFVFLAANTPLVIMVWQAYDDDLFVRIGESFAGGRWLGRFSALTLAKGPGYSMFLAASYWSGLPITITQALFYVGAVGAVALIALRATGSRAWAVALFGLTLFHPKILEPARVMRDSIYMSQSLLVLALYAYGLFFASAKYRGRVMLGAGIVLGWFWLTRDEGVWILPGLAVLAGFSFLASKRDGLALASWLRPNVLFAAAFAGVLLLFSTLNLLTYGRFVGVDFKSGDFQSAISAMESVKVGPPVPFVSVPRSTRLRLYEVSPTFRTLRKHLDPEGTTSPWEAGGCMFRPAACGDLGNGFFMWALRDAAEKEGHYVSPREARKFFSALTDEIEAACGRGAFRCSKDYIPMLPPLTKEQLDWIPRSLRELGLAIFFPGPYPGHAAGEVVGDPARFENTLDFLNYPAHLPKQDVPNAHVELTGWYYDKSDGREWFSLLVSDAKRKDVAPKLDRVDSPDLVISQKDTAASRQRFKLSMDCVASCNMVFRAPDGASTEVAIAASSDRLPAQFYSVGGALLVFDNLGTVVRAQGGFPNTKIRIATSIREGLYPLYGVLMPLLIGLGLVSYLYASARSIRTRTWTLPYAMASACWILIVTRAIILVLVDISSFPAIHTPYLLPIFSLCIVASIFSLTAAIHTHGMSAKTGAPPATSAV